MVSLCGAQRRGQYKSLDYLHKGIGHLREVPNITQALLCAPGATRFIVLPVEFFKGGFVGLLLGLDDLSSDRQQRQGHKLEEGAGDELDVGHSWGPRKR